METVLFFLHTSPEAFTNHHILKPDSRNYSSELLSHIPVGSVYWDGYYKVGRRDGGGGMFAILLQNASLRIAWYLVLLSAILYLIFYSRREQRIIPIVKRFDNKTMEYTRTIGSMYFEEGYPADILDKRMKYFKEFIAKRFYIRDVSFSDKEALQLSDKTTFPQEKAEKLYRIMRNLKDRKVISDEQLLAATKRLNEFYNYI